MGNRRLDNFCVAVHDYCADPPPQHRRPSGHLISEVSATQQNTGRGGIKSKRATAKNAFGADFHHWGPKKRKKIGQSFPRGATPLS